MSDALVTIRMCYVYNQWYDISCATLYFQKLVYLLFSKFSHWLFLTSRLSEFYVLCHSETSEQINPNTRLNKQYINIFFWSLVCSVCPAFYVRCFNKALRNWNELTVRLYDVEGRPDLGSSSMDVLPYLKHWYHS